MEITSNATRIRLVAFQLESKSQVWWDLVKAFMGKYFLESARHAKAWEFQELKQGTMIVLKYMAKFTELARFTDDYVATDMAKVRKFEDGMKLSIRGKIVASSYKTWT